MTKSSRLFLNPPLFLVAEAEGLKTLDGRKVGRIGNGALVVLARGLCRFHYFEPPHSASGERVFAAAQTFARTHAPFQQSGWLVQRAGDGAGVWWWDAAAAMRLAPDLEPLSDIIFVPETVAHPPAAGWRHARVRDGYEAQAWRDGALVASVWRRTPFDVQAWLAVTLSEAAEGAPQNPPPIEDVAVRPALAIRAARRSANAGPWKWLETGALMGGLIGLACTGYFASQTLAFRAAENEAKVSLAAHADSPEVMRAKRDAALADAFRQHSASANNLTLSASAVAKARASGFTVLGWGFDEKRLHLRLDAESTSEALQTFAVSLEAEPGISRVASRYDSSNTEVSISASLGDKR